MKNNFFTSAVAWMLATMKKDLALAVMMLALSALGLAQTVTDQTRAAQGLPDGSPTSTTCSFTFSSGANNTFLKFCVTATGNITQLETPAGHEHILIGTIAEGYGVCNESPATAYWDYAGDGESGNWGPAILVNQTTTSVKIVRNTGDGIWTLTQTITQIAGTPAVKVVMALKNNTAAARTAYLVRYADVDSSAGSENFSATQNSAFGWNNSVGITSFGFGLVLQNVGTSQFAFTNGYARDTFHGPNPCDFAAHSPGVVLTNIDGSVAVAYVGSVGANQTKTVTLNYKGM
jgi:hypothetical protein